MLISIGGIVYIMCCDAGHKVAGAVFFSVGLFGVLSYSLYLYTGKVCYVFENDRKYSLEVLLTIVGNFVGCLFMGLLFTLPTAATMVEAKLALEPLVIIAKGFGCGILMFLAVDTYKRKNSFLGVLLGVPTFILAGFEHSIADMFYFSSALYFSPESFLVILLVLVGNLFGCALIPVCRKFMGDEENPQ